MGLRICPACRMVSALQTESTLASTALRANAQHKGPLHVPAYAHAHVHMIDTKFPYKMSAMALIATARCMATRCTT